MERRESGSGRRFAEAQMLKHGWTQGKGLGRFESGRAEAIKVKVKQGTAGIGHDVAEQFTFHWWDHVFNKAAASIAVEGTEEGATVTRSRSEGPAVEPISNRKPRRALLGKTHALYGNFVKAATLTSGEEVRDEDEEEERADGSTSSSEDEDSRLDLSSTTRMTDEQLLRACGGRTAHKGARHGVTMSAKLARLEQQEREFLSRWGGGAGGGDATRDNPASPRPASDAAAIATATCEPELKRSKKKKKSKRERSEDSDRAGVGEPVAEVEEAEAEGGSADVRSRPKKKKKSKWAGEQRETSPDGRVVRDESDDAGRADAKRRRKRKRDKSEARARSGDTRAAAGGGGDESDTRDGSDGVAGGDGCCGNDDEEENVDRSERKKKKKQKKREEREERCVERGLRESGVAPSDELSAKTAKKRKQKTKERL